MERGPRLVAATESRAKLPFRDALPWFHKAVGSSPTMLRGAVRHGGCTPAFPSPLTVGGRRSDEPKSAEHANNTQAQDPLNTQSGRLCERSSRHATRSAYVRHAHTARGPDSPVDSLKHHVAHGPCPPRLSFRMTTPPPKPPS
jgi:hypothetical protein